MLTLLVQRQHVVHNERGPDHGLHESQEHEPERPRVSVQVEAERSDEPENPDAPSSALTGGATVGTRLLVNRVVHETAHPFSLT